MRISDISLLTLAEEEQLLRGFNTTAVAYEQEKSIVDLFEEQVKKSPDALAVVFKETKLSYGELNSRCNQLGHYLRSKGVTAETVVPVCMDRSVEMLVGILGILKAGGAYVPIDPGYPAERIGYMLEDTGATLVLTTKVNRPRLASSNQIEIIELDSDIGPLSQYPSGNDQPISVRGQIPLTGGFRTYQAWYRNAAPYCTPSTFNLTNGLQLTWLP
jgi:non-ribosomal peptide synthetase component F